MLVDGSCLPAACAPTVRRWVITQKEENMMRRTSPILLVVVAIGLMPLMDALSQKKVDSRTAARSATIKRVQVNAQTITALPSGKKYVVDLTQRGVVYEFDSKTNWIDFSRVMVRTARGKVTIASYLEKTLAPGKLPSIKNSSLSLVLGNRATRTIQTPLTSGLISCPAGNPDNCWCDGESDCQILLDKVCGGFICIKLPDRPVYCECQGVA